MNPEQLKAITGNITPLPIKIQEAKQIAKLGYDEVIIFGANYATGTQHVTTYGKSEAACENAARGGNAIKKLLNWPPEKTNAKPRRQIKREQFNEAIELLAEMVKEFESAAWDTLLSAKAKELIQKAKQ
jgi:hypothetical protein